MWGQKEMNGVVFCRERSEVQNMAEHTRQSVKQRIKFFTCSIKTMKQLFFAAVLFVGVTQCCVAQQTMSRTQFKQMQQATAQMKAVERFEHQKEVLERRQENNTRALVTILFEEDIQKGLKITEKQKQTLDAIHKKLDEERKKITHPEGRQFANKEERLEYLKTKVPEIQALTLKCGKAIKEVLTEEQLNAYGRHITAENAKQLWERRMGIEPEVKPKPEKKNEKK